MVSQGNLGTEVAGQVGTAAPVLDSASGVPVSDSARPVTPDAFLDLDEFGEPIVDID